MANRAGTNRSLHPINVILRLHKSCRMTDRSDTASGVLQRGDDETRTAREVVRLAVHVVIDELVVERQQVELDSTVDGCVDKSVEDVETQVAVVA